MNLARTIDNAFLALSEFMGGGISSQCRLSTSAGEHTLSADDGTLITFFELKGSIQLFGSSEFNHVVESVYQSCSGPLQSSGHSLQFVIQRDPDGSYEELASHYDPIKKSAKAMNIDIDRIVDDTMQKQSLYVASERVWVVVWTYPYALPPSVKKKAQKKAAKSNVPVADRYTMDMTYVPEIKKTHENFCNSIESGFSKSGLWFQKLNTHETLWWIRKINDPEMTSKGWSALLPGDPLPLREAEAGDRPLSGALYPSLPRQLYPRPALTDGDSVKIGNYIHKPFSMEFAPQQPQVFMQLFNDLLKHGFGWRISFHVSGDGLAGTGLKKTLAQILAFTSTENRMLLGAIRNLRDRQLNGDTIVQFEMNFDTWVNSRDYKSEKDARDALSINFNYFVASVQSWGTMDIRDIPGDPLLPLAGSTPGIALKTPSNKAAAPLREVLSMLPFTRPTSPWNTGSLILRSVDGKIFPVQMLSSKQASWIEVGGGGLGAGKSFWISTTNWSYVFQPGLDELPYLGIIDIGPSSSGFIKLLRTALPENQKKYVAEFKLRMDQHHSINPFDTPVGIREPFESHKTFLVNLLSVFCTPLDKEAPPDGVSGLVRMCIERAYKDSSDKKAKLYQPNLDLAVDSKLQHLDLALDEHTTWWEIVDAFFAEGMHHEATLAQRHAVPLLAEVASYTFDDGIKALYNFKEESTGQDITEFVNRKLTEATGAYPIFQRATRFDLGEARIVSLDLDDVAPKGGPEANRQSGVMYLIAMHLLSGNYFYGEEDTREVPAPYKEYHKAAIKKLKQLPKKLVMDEFHRAARTGPIMLQVINTLETLSRESRKHLISLAFYSQKLEDMPSIITDLANTIYILGAGNPDVQKLLITKFGLNSAGAHALNMLGTPDARGANCLAIYRVKGGVVQQLVTNTLGSQQLWAFSTTREDMGVRDELYTRCNHQDVLELLAKEHPAGVKDHILKLRREYADAGIRKDAIESVVEDIEDKIKRRKARAA